VYKTGRICLHNEKDLFTPDYLFLYGKGFVYSKREGFVYITGKICLHLIIYFFTGKDLFTLNWKDLFTGRICLHNGKDLFTLNGKDLFTPDFYVFTGKDLFTLDYLFLSLVSVLVINLFSSSICFIQRHYPKFSSRQMMSFGQGGRKSNYKLINSKKNGEMCNEDFAEDISVLLHKKDVSRNELCL